MKAEQSGDPQPAGAATAPATVSDIPGLGPIRVRAFAKAGVRSIDSLRNMSLDELAAVPGITRIKAQYIQDYLKQFSHAELEAAAARAEASRITSQQAQVDSISPAEWSSLPVSPFTLEMARIIASLVAFLTRSPGSEIRNRLLSSANRLSSECFAAISIGAQPTTDQERVLRKLRRVSDTIHASIAGNMDRKEQGRLADELLSAADTVLTLREQFMLAQHNLRRSPGL